MSSSQFLSDFNKLLEREIGNCDVIIYAGEGNGTKKIHAHSNILGARSSYFHLVFSNVWAEKWEEKFIIRKSHIPSGIIEIILRFIYCGIIELDHLKGPLILQLLMAVVELINFQPLVAQIQSHFIQHQIEFLYQDPVDILDISFEHEMFMGLQYFCLKNICKEPKILFDSDKFFNLKANSLKILLKRSDLNMDEIEIWEKLLLWCFAQQNVRDDPERWSNNEVIKLKGMLSNFIPLIKFRAIKPADFYCKVYLYKNILPEDLISDLLKYHMVTPPSNIISSRRKSTNHNK